MFWLSALMSIIIISAVIIAAQFFNIIFRGYAPFISTKPKVIKKILEETEFLNSEKFQVYELGCGKAGFLSALNSKCPKCTLIGIEYFVWPWFITKMQTSLTKSKIKIIKKNLFKVDLSRADLIYCYLNPKMMAKLAEKFKNECRPGTQIISYAFSIPNFNTTKTIDLEDSSKVYFYKI